MKYGSDGYAIYWYCLECIAGRVDKNNLTFNLEEDSEIISYELKVAEHRVEEIMQYMVNLGLFEEADGIITCLKLAKRFDKSMTNSPKMRKWLELKSSESVMTLPDDVNIVTDSSSTCAELEENRIKYNKDINNMSDSDESNAPQKKRLTVPYSEIESLYKDILVNTGEAMSMVNVQTLTKERKTRIKQYWTANGDKGLEGVKAYFQYLWNNRNNHSWLFGAGNRGWKADIEFIMREKTVTKARENTLGNWSEQQ